ncbi:hypothetical protein WMW72_03130 [Paenibacillus filicis]|uniref:Uncharacterized protein n=1 Tax=Paenibacillus filicis TaxID=669464 RepID=A0ABU9DDG5_9BACL
MTLLKRKTLISLAVIAAVLGGGGYWAYDYALNLAADKIAVELSKELDKNTELSGELDKLLASGQNPTSSTGVKDGGQSSAATPSGTEKPGSTPVGPSATGNAQEQKDAESNEQSTNSTNVGPATPSSNGDKSPGNPDLQFTDRQQAVKFVMGRFTASEINNIRQMASGDLTPEKKAELKKIAYSKFTQAEIDAVRKAVSK